MIFSFNNYLLNKITYKMKRKNNLFATINSKDFETVEKFKKQIDKIYSQHLAEKKVNDFMVNKKILFNDVINIFEEISPELFKQEKGRNMIYEFINTITKDTSLTNMYLLHEEIYTPKNIDEPKSFLNEAPNLIGKIDKKKINEGTKKLWEITKKGLYLVGNDINIDEVFCRVNKTINESINYITTSKKNIKNMSLFENSVKILTKFINERKGNVNNNDYIEKYTDEIVKQFNLNPNNTITNDNKKQTFESYKNECLGLINSLTESTNEKDLEKLNNFKIKLTEKVYSDKSFDDDISKLIELKKTLLQ